MGKEGGGEGMTLQQQANAHCFRARVSLGLSFKRGLYMLAYKPLIDKSGATNSGACSQQACGLYGAIYVCTGQFMWTMRCHYQLCVDNVGFLYRIY